ncbi:hypothetical protein CENSYa_1571 [Cenarchaeum symbiosum A]|uniref:PEFG-CTERM sorting domain-containing protein n=1 Tax=Cenarchaeum symbiosum (strain A) TaxID=414004 RepID=A0RXX4_CENSY|nr:hypothetical protein CENSYa_1571 [Cenarchaeum symbiosum A]
MINRCSVRVIPFVIAAAVLLAVLYAQPPQYAEAQVQDFRPPPPPTMTVRTSEGMYEQGDVVVISGRVSTVFEGEVTIQVFLDTTLVEIDQLPVAQDGSYSVTINAEGNRWSKPGTYTVRATYGEDTIETTFEYATALVMTETTKSFEVGAGDSGTFDVPYTIVGGTVQNMYIDPPNLSLIVIIEAEGNGALTVDLPRDWIDSKDPGGADEEYIVLVDGSEIIHTQVVQDSEIRKVRADFTEESTEIIIIGTEIIPEFGAALPALAAAVAAAAAISRRKLTV